MVRTTRGESAIGHLLTLAPLSMKLKFVHISKRYSIFQSPLIEQNSPLNEFKDHGDRRTLKPSAFRRFLLQVTHIGPEAAKSVCILASFAHVSALKLKRETTSFAGIDKLAKYHNKSELRSKRRMRSIS